MNAILPTMPSENWDDDFEFHQRTTTSTNGKHDLHVDHRVSMASSDWDRDDDATEKKRNFAPLAEWAEPGPSTPSKHHSARSTENWDDDFEDSPIRKTFPSPPRRDKSGLRQTYVSKTENWDEDFEGMRTPARTAPSTPSRTPLQARVTSSGSNSDHDGRNAVDLDFGYAERDEEDRTVTARSRRAALARLTTNSPSTPPPPVPSLPLPFLLNHNNITSSPHPFPRSPTTSVFTVPRPPSSSAFTVTSTTHLRPTVSRSSSSGLSALPPSPPIHRERRRLRKKSRPPGFGGSEPSRVREDRDGYETGDMDTDMDMRPCTPPPPSHALNGVNGTPASANTSTGSVSGAGALLSRIGSVKKWGVRRKRGSTAPGDILTLDTKSPRRLPHETDHNLTPRPKSQASVASSSESFSRTRPKSKRMSASPIPSTSPSNTNWFFRSGSGGSTATNASNMSSAYPSSISTSATSPSVASPPIPVVGPRGSNSELNLRDRGMSTINIGSPAKMYPLLQGEHTSSSAPSSTPSKLMKRKSLGFVQLRRGFGGHVGFEDEKKRRASASVPHAQQPVPKYGGLGLGRVNGGSVSEDPFPQEDEGDEDERKNSAGLIRRLSLSGRHKRTKSGVSLGSVAEVLGVPAREDTTTPRPGLKQRQQHQQQEKEKEREQVMPPPSPPPAVPPLPLLPPIELQPPSPPQTVSSGTVSSAGLTGDILPSPPRSGLAAAAVDSLNSTQAPPISPSRRSLRTPGSPQSASLGRSTIVPVNVVGSVGAGGSGVGVGERERVMVPRRNSLGDLKIPERISQAQIGLKRDLGMVREFAANIEQLKELQATYNDLVGQVQGILDAQMHLHAQQQQLHQQPARATSPSFFAGLSKPHRTRLRSNTNPPPPTVPSNNTLSLPSSSTDSVAPHLAYKQLASAFYTINSRYRISWECAELLIELGAGGGGGGGNASLPLSAPSTSVSAPAMQSVIGVGVDLKNPKGTRERAITLAGDESKPPTPIPGATFDLAAATAVRGTTPTPTLSWRASTGRHDLSQRQLVLLKEMLHSADSTNGLATANEEDEGGASSSPTAMLSVNREWRWGEAMSSTVTLPSEDSSTGGGGEGGKRKKKRLGMAGLRDMLRSLKRSYSDNTSAGVRAGLPSSVSLTTTDNSSQEGHLYPHPHLPSVSPATTTQQHGRRRAKTSSGPESVRIGRPTSPYGPSSSLSTKPSPRRPSLASIFRIGQKNKDKAHLPPELPLDLRGSDNFSGWDLSRPDSARSASRNESADTGGEEEEDWDRIDLGVDLVANGSGTVRGKGSGSGGARGRSMYLQELRLPPGGRPLTPKRSVSGSQSSLWRGEAGGKESPTPMPIPPPLPLPQQQQGSAARMTRLSNVEEHVDDLRAAVAAPRSSSRASRKPGASPSNSRPPSRDVRLKTGSVRSMPPTPPMLSSAGPDPKLAMTPENIKPLLENAKEVLFRLNECIAEIEALLAAYLHS